MTDKNTDEEIQELEGKLKELKQKSPNHEQSPYLVPAAIVIAGLLIAGAVFMKGDSPPQVADNTVPQQQQQPLAPPDTTNVVRPVTSEDHILGSLDAPVKIVEYSDFECPFCKRIHPTLGQIVDEFGGDQVAWVYRHFPLDSLHPVKARLEAVTSECVAELGGNDAFWRFTNRFYELTPSNNRTDTDVVLPQIVSELGLSQAAVDECIESGRYDQQVQDDVENGFATGGNGTPWSVVIAPNGKTFGLSGAQPYQQIKALVELAMKER